MPKANPLPHLPAPVAGTGPVARFLSHKTFLITGATGFLAKGLVEKILYSAPEVRRIYLLIRPTRHSSVEQRLEREVLASPAFERLRTSLGNRFPAVMREKIVPVAGDLSRDRLGLSAERYAELSREVDVVINSAATVVFDEQLDLALELNTFGPLRVLEFAKSCVNATFLHVSTAYVSGQRHGTIPEELLPPDRSVAQVITPDRTDHQPYEVHREIEILPGFLPQGGGRLLAAGAAGGVPPRDRPRARGTRAE